MNIYRHTNKLATLAKAINYTRYFSNKSCMLTKPQRSVYLRQYPTLIVQPDGSTFTVRYHEPRKIIKLPLDLSTLSEEEKLVILENRKPKKKVAVKEEDIGDFDHKKILQLLKKK